MLDVQNASIACGLSAALCLLHEAQAALDLIPDTNVSVAAAYLSFAIEIVSGGPDAA